MYYLFSNSLLPLDYLSSNIIIAFSKGSKTFWVESLRLPERGRLVTNFHRHKISKILNSIFNYMSNHLFSSQTWLHCSLSSGTVVQLALQACTHARQPQTITEDPAIKLLKEHLVKIQKFKYNSIKT